jgi:hypothetical protein
MIPLVSVIRNASWYAEEVSNLPESSTQAVDLFALAVRRRLSCVVHGMVVSHGIDTNTRERRSEPKY